MLGEDAPRFVSAVSPLRFPLDFALLARIILGFRLAFWRENGRLAEKQLAPGVENGAKKLHNGIAFTRYRIEIV